VTRAVLAACALIVLVPAAAGAQAGRQAPRRPVTPPRVEIGIGAGIAGGLNLGERDATLGSNNTNQTPFRLFATRTRVEPSPFVDVRLGYRLTPRLTVEGTLAFARPHLTSSLSEDVEDAAAVEATSALTEYLIDAGALWRLSASTRRRWSPFVSGGLGVARHVHDGKALIESGIGGYVGGGLLYSLGARSGLRVDGRVRFLNGGLAEGQGVLRRGTLSGSIFVAF
jgi:hypothetical protein